MLRSRATNVLDAASKTALVPGDPKVRYRNTVAPKHKVQRMYGVGQRIVLLFACSCRVAQGTRYLHAPPVRSGTG